MSSERTVAVVPAAGRGERMGAAINKVYLPLVDRPVIAHTLGVLEASPLVDEVVLAVAAGEIDYCRREVIEPFELRKVAGMISGGASRRETVSLALRYIGGAADLIVIHDGARPLLPAGLLLQAIEAGRASGAVVVGLPLDDTVKRVSEAGSPGPTAATAPVPRGVSRPVRRVVETLARSALWRVQTPQVFWRDLLEMAHSRAGDETDEATDDASLVERLHHPVLVVPGSPENLKVTSPLDLVLARAILADRTRRRGKEDEK